MSLSTRRPTRRRLLSTFDTIRIRSSLLMNSLKVAVTARLSHLHVSECLGKSRTSLALLWAESVACWLLSKSLPLLLFASAARKAWIAFEIRRTTITTITIPTLILLLSHRLLSRFLPRSPCILSNLPMLPSSLLMSLSSLLTSLSSLATLPSSLPMSTTAQLRSSAAFLCSSAAQLRSSAACLYSTVRISSPALILSPKIACLFYTDSLPRKEYRDANFTRGSPFRVGWRWNNQLRKDQLFARSSNFIIW